ncbi:hypothetical protein [uncultured phage MedDCM-OCT-S05-C113]|nr:hypothetical protein [uncultured phage MedDCM-OCT-S05-C113]|tara:strand:+ start:114 stop:509 length:396 start_codon:yes stop_codon:yes gene_type:complete
MFSAIIGPISSLAGTWLEGRVNKAKAETEVKVAKAKAEAKVYETSATSDMLNEQALTNQMAGSWKDEFWTLIFGGILVASFLPFSQPFVKEGFIFLENSTPGWFSTCLYICIGSSFGYRFGKTGLQLMNKK